MTEQTPPPMPGAVAQPAPPEAPQPAASATTSAAKPLSSTCPNCGAQTAYAPGTSSLKCGSCGSLLEIAGPDVAIQEHSYDDWTAHHGDLLVASIGAETMRCQGCGATTETTDLAGTCQFCGGALIAVAHPDGLIAPEAVLPFGVDKAGAQKQFGSWARSRWFAPNALKKIGSAERLAGTYLPHWTFDAHTESDYAGQRGDYYYVTQTRQVSDGKGGSRTESYQERRTRWRPASGHVGRAFDDVLVPASERVPLKRLSKLGPWKLTEARPFQPEYLTGYSALRYDVDPQTGAATARKEMRQVIKTDVKQDIGGDEQVVDHLDVTYSQAMFKLIMLPLWLATYLYAGKTWQVTVNANTGEVIGERPYSKAKIVLAVLAVLIIVAVIVAAVLASKSGSS